MALDTDFSDMKKTFVTYPVFFNYKQLKCVSTFWDTLYNQHNITLLILANIKCYFLTKYIKINIYNCSNILHIACDNTAIFFVEYFNCDLSRPLR